MIFVMTGMRSSRHRLSQRAGGPKIQDLFGFWVVSVLMKSTDTGSKSDKAVPRKGANVASW